ncbi:MAG: carboxymuconolactone decarboxylase family protein [Actinomycetales bacterium]
MAYVSTDPTTFGSRPPVLVRAALAAARRVSGEDLDTLGAMAHRQGVLLPWMLLEAGTMRMKSVLPGELAELVVFVVANRLGCSWCIDYSSARWECSGLDPSRLEAAARWRERPEAFDATSLAAFAFAEAVCADPLEDTSMLAATLGELVGEQGVVEVAYWAALENLRSRFNAALGLTSQGFADRCRPVTRA